MDKVVERMTELLTSQGKTQAALCEHLGLRKDMYSRWKRGELKSYLMYTSEIADFLNVSTDYLLCRTEHEVSSGNLTGAETRLLSRFRALPDNEQLWLLQAIGYLEKTTKI